MALRHRRWDGGYVDVADPFLYHKRPSVFSVREILVHLRISKQSAIYLWRSTLPASFKSLFVT